MYTCIGIIWILPKFPSGSQRFDGVSLFHELVEFHQSIKPKYLLDTDCAGWLGGIKIISYGPCPQGAVCLEEDTINTQETSEEQFCAEGEVPTFSSKEVQRREGVCIYGISVVRPD